MKARAILGRRTPGLSWPVPTAGAGKPAPSLQGHVHGLRYDLRIYVTAAPPPGGGALFLVFFIIIIIFFFFCAGSFT